MQDIAEADPGSPALRELSEILDLKAAGQLTADFLALRGRPIDVDAARAERLGGLCLQVLLSAAKTWKMDEIPFAVINPSPEFLEGLARFGISITDLIYQDATQ